MSKTLSKKRPRRPSTVGVGVGVGVTTTISSRTASASASAANAASRLHQQQQQQQQQQHLRLAWGGGGNISSKLQSLHKGESNDNNHNNNHNENHNNNNNDLWMDRFEPKTIPELCVAPKKVQQVQAWIDSATSTCSTNNSVTACSSTVFKQPQPKQQPQRLLILMGNPGIGKSTMVRVLLCQTSSSQQKISIQEWTEEPHCEQPLTSFLQFLQQTQYSSVLQSSSSSSLSTTNNNHHNHNHIHNHNHNNDTNDTNVQRSIVLLDELPHLHTEDQRKRFRNAMSHHIQTCPYPTIWIYSNTNNNNNNNKASYGSSDSRYSGTNNNYNNGGGGGLKSLESYIHPHILYHSGLITMIQINPVTNAKMKKILQSILVRGTTTTTTTPQTMSATRRKGRTTSKAKTTNTPTTTTILSDAMIESFHGDLRHAIMTLQFASSKSVSISNNKTTSTTQSSSSLSSNHRDVVVSPFHALGKLLYAKRDVQTQKWQYHETAETILSSSSASMFSLSSSVYFLQSHAVDFFMDISDLSHAMDRYSDAAIFMDMYLDSYATSLASRATATENHHPTPSKFRSFTSPKIFQVQRKRTENQLMFEFQLQRQLHHSHRSTIHQGGGGGFSSGGCSSGCGNLTNFIVDEFPYLRRIDPHATSCWNLHSHVHDDKTTTHASANGNTTTSSSFTSRQGHRHEETTIVSTTNVALLEQQDEHQFKQDQDEILAMDDIEDFSD